MSGPIDVSVPSGRIFEDVQQQRFELRYGGWNARFLGLLGLGPRWSQVLVSTTDVEVAMGWGFRATIPRTSIVRARPTDERVWGWGVHGWRGRWLVNGSSKGLVRLEIDPPAPSHVCGVRGRLRELTVSLEEPDRLLSTLAVPR